MATKVLEFEGPEGLTLTVVSHPVDTPNSTITATSVTEIRDGLYQASFTDPPAGLTRFEATDTNGFLGRGLVQFGSAAGTYRETIETVPTGGYLGGSAGGSGGASELYYYGTIDDADLYFSQRLKSEDWENATEANKEKALYQSTRLIDQLNFRGEKTSSTQALEFPRGGDTAIPGRIVQAAYLVAIKLLGNYEADLELDLMGQTRSRFGTQVEIEKLSIPHGHTMSGVPSVEAWRLLYPYLRDASEIRLVRVD